MLSRCRSRRSNGVITNRWWTKPETQKFERDRCPNDATRRDAWTRISKTTEVHTVRGLDMNWKTGGLRLAVCVRHYVRVRNRLYTRVQLGTCAYRVTRNKVSSVCFIPWTFRDTNSLHNLTMTREGTPIFLQCDFTRQTDNYNSHPPFFYEFLTITKQRCTVRTILKCRIFLSEIFFSINDEKFRFEPDPTSLFRSGTQYTWTGKLQTYRATTETTSSESYFILFHISRILVPL